jgi:hypothetical protein
MAATTQGSVPIANFDKSEAEGKRRNLGALPEVRKLSASFSFVLKMVRALSL